LKYIEWGEKQSTKDGSRWSEVPSVSGRTFWWGIGHNKFPEVIFPCGIANIYKIFDNSIQVLNDKRLYEIYTKGNEATKYLMTSTLFSFFIEIESRAGLGDGLLDITVYEVAENLLPNTDLFDKKKTMQIKKIYEKLLSRSLQSIFSEVKQQDRIELDTVILGTLGIDVNIYLPKIYEGLCELVKERLELPKMRKKKQKEEVKYARDKVKEDVIADCLENGIRKFPEDFYTEGNYDNLEFESYPTNGKRLVAESFFDSFQMKTEEGEMIFELDSEIKAKLAELLSKRNIYQIKIPKEERIIEQVIKNYYSYAKKLKEQLEVNAKEKTHDWAKAEKIAQEIMTDYGLYEGDLQ
jgi:hypothetical protein